MEEKKENRSIKFTTDEGVEIDLFVVADTKLNGKNYLLVTDSEILTLHDRRTPDSRRKEDAALCRFFVRLFLCGIAAGCIGPRGTDAERCCSADPSYIKGDSKGGK